MNKLFVIVMTAAAAALATGQVGAAPTQSQPAWHAPMLPPKAPAAPPVWHAPMLPPKPIAIPPVVIQPAPKVDLKDLTPKVDYTKPPQIPKDQVQFPSVAPLPEQKEPSGGAILVPDGKGGVHGGGSINTKDGTIVHGTGSVDGRGNGYGEIGVIVNPLPASPKTATPEDEMPEGR